MKRRFLYLISGLWLLTLSGCAMFGGEPPEANNSAPQPVQGEAQAQQVVDAQPPSPTNAAAPPPPAVKGTWEKMNIPYIQNSSRKLWEGIYLICGEWEQCTVVSNTIARLVIRQEVGGKATVWIDSEKRLVVSYAIFGRGKQAKHMVVLHHKK